MIQSNINKYIKIQLNIQLKISLNRIKIYISINFNRNIKLPCIFSIIFKCQSCLDILITY